MPRIRQLDNQRTTEAYFFLPQAQVEFYKQKYHRIIFRNADLDEKANIAIRMHDICISNQPLQHAIIDGIGDTEHERTNLPKYHGISSEDVHELYEPWILEKLEKHQKKIIKMWSKSLADKVLVVIDDAITSGAYKQSKQDAFAMFATPGQPVDGSKPLLISRKRLEFPTDCRAVDDFL